MLCGTNHATLCIFLREYNQTIQDTPVHYLFSYNFANFSERRLFVKLREPISYVERQQMESSVTSKSKVPQLQ